MSERGAMDETHDDARYCELADRRALDEPLAPDELEFLLAHDAGGPAYEAERALWASLAALDQPAPLDDEDRARAARVIASYRAGRSGRSRRLGASVGALALAAAAAIALWLSPHPELAAPLRVTEGALLQRD
ncbi:MAG: hypothetical protein KC636_30310, partial [Myxococcales bacterium]|nr:hypothetical protein [Myxococcales bacterium]